MSGAPLTEFVIEGIIRDGLNELRLSPTAFDFLFKKFTEAHFMNQYGQDKIDELKTYIQNNQIKIVHAMQVAPTDMPCISIRLTASDEREEDQQFSNELEELDTAKTPDIYVDNMTISAYDTTTGRLTVSSASDLAPVCPGLIFVDSAGTKFSIGSGNSNEAGNKYINIGPGKTVDISGTTRIESFIDITRNDIRMIRLRETILLGCHALNKLHLAKFMYYILVYIIKSRQEAMINRGLCLDRGVASIFDREGEFEGEHIFTRYMELGVLTEFSWDQGEVNLIDCFDLDTKACNPDGTTFNTNTSEDC